MNRDEAAPGFFYPEAANRVLLIALSIGLVITAVAAAAVQSLLGHRFARWTALGVIFMASSWAAAGGLAILLRYSSSQQTAAPATGTCEIFPADNVWNTRIDGLPADPRSRDYVTAIGDARPVHLDLSIPYNVVTGGRSQTVVFEDGSESDAGPYRFPEAPLIEPGSDHHLLVLEAGNCTLYELFAAAPGPGASWRAASGAIFDLRSNHLRARDWTSADAAGLPIFPGLLRYDEVNSGAIRHAIRFTAPKTRAAYVWPARHRASRLTDDHLPPMGQRFRLRADFPVSQFSKPARVILTALQNYGLILADNGSPWFLSGAPDARWNYSALQDEMRRVHGADFEAIDESALVLDGDSGQVRRTDK